jgi:hypothetical protein
MSRRPGPITGFSVGLACALLLCQTDGIRQIRMELVGHDVRGTMLSCREVRISRTLDWLFGPSRGHEVRYSFTAEETLHQGVATTSGACPDGPEIVVRYAAGAPRVSSPFFPDPDAPLIGPLLLALSALLCARAGLIRLVDAARAVGALRWGRVVRGETLPDFPLALAAGPVNLVPVVLRGEGLLVEVIDPWVRAAAGPALLIAPGRPLVAWDQLPHRPEVTAHGALAAVPLRSFRWQSTLPVLSLLLAGLLVVSLVRVIRP